MAHSEEYYRAAAHSLGGGFLSSKFSQSNLEEAEVSRPHRNEAIKENDILLAGENGPIAGIIERGAQASKSTVTAQQKQSKDAKRSMDNVLFLNLLGQADTYAAQLAADVAKMEANYEAQYGDAWVEQIALEVLGPDEIPERRDGEDILSYRERVRETLRETMIDPATGTVRAEHANSPHKQWAERAWKQEEIAPDVEAMNDESLSQEERQAAAQRIVDTRDQDTIRYANTSNEVGEAEYEMMGQTLTELEDEAGQNVQTEAVMNDFLAP